MSRADDLHAAWTSGVRADCLYAIPDLLAVVRALEEIAEQQPKLLEVLRKHGVVFDGPLGNDPKNFQHVAFSIYTVVCEIDSIARAALAAFEEGGK